jgi:polyisoprenyl-phosphate glycosyltransferase
LSSATPVACHLSIVVPFLNEEASLPELLRTFAQTAGLSESREVIFVSDGSTDGSVSIIRAAAEADERIKLVVLSRNFGHQPAVTAGLEHATGDYVAVMDADLQDEPRVLVDMLRIAEEGAWDTVFAVRAVRHGSTLKKLCYSVFYRLYHYLSDTPVNVDSGDFCVMSHRCHTLLMQLPEKIRFHRGLRSWVGLRQTSHPVERPERFAGDAQYTWKGLVQLAITGLTSFSVRPLRLAAFVGFWLCLASILGAVGYAIAAIVFDIRAAAPGFTTIVCLLLLLNGMVLVQLGILGEYLGSLFLEVKGRPAYLVESRVNLDCPPAARR